MAQMHICVSLIGFRQLDFKFRSVLRPQDEISKLNKYTNVCSV